MKLKNHVLNYFSSMCPTNFNRSQVHSDILVSVSRAAELLRNGHVVAIPTETVYGLAADITQPKAIEKIFSTKQRPFFDPLIVHISHAEQMINLIQPNIFSNSQKPTIKDMPRVVLSLIEKFWPGPLTMVLPKSSNVNSMITSGLETVAIRMPNHKFSLELIRELGRPVAAPSANLFGHTSPTTAQHVVDEFQSSVPVVDGGPCSVGVESTVIGFNSEFTKISIYRPGAITRDMLAQYAPTEMAPTPVADAPGQLKHHYMPKIPLIYLKKTEHLTIELYEALKTQLNVKQLHPSWVTLPSDSVLAARHLYASLRWAAERPHANCILLRRPRDLEISDSNMNHEFNDILNDRLTKASTLTL